MAKVVRDTDRKENRLGVMAAVVVGLTLVGTGIFMLLSFLTGDAGVDPSEAAEKCWTGLFGAWLAFGGIYTFGYAPSLVLAALVTAWGGHVIRELRVLATWPQVFGGILIVASASLGVCAFADSYDTTSGGLLAVYVSPPAILYFGRWGLVLAAAGVMVLGILLAFGEAAVHAVHQFLHFVRNALLGIGGVCLRLKELLWMLLSPRLAVAGGAVADAGARGGFNGAAEYPRGGTRTGTDKPSADTRTDGVESADGEPEGAGEDSDEFDGGEPSPQKTPLKEWRPRGEFRARFLNLDFRDRSSSAIAEPVQAAIAPEPEETAEKRPDVIMDVDVEDDGANDSAEKDASDVIADPITAANPEPASAAVTGSAPEAKSRPASAARGGAYGCEKAPRSAAANISDLSEYRLPPLDLLDPPEPPVMEDRALIEAKARILEQTLGEFKIEGRVVHIERGPRVTMYEISLAPGIRLSKVTSLADNISMQLQAESVRIIAPIPGKNTIGIEIPNTTKELVSLKEIVASVNREKRRQALPVCLGKDVSGQALIADLARMPHLLIAGATGSGKSVCINSVILSIMMCCRPDETQLIMVDPKVVELSRFKDIPHLMSPVITDMKRAVSVLEWICQKMDERYEQMSMVSVNNIAKFNALGEDGIRDRLDAFASLEDIDAFPKKMPYMVVIIDELADLMMVAGKEVEQHITRLAAKSRAVGIHLILATQRPSVDVITGLIKANMPCRIAFQVASRVDSRTILDGNGAETLLGQGDMLYLPPGVGKLTRAQGVFVSDEELFRIVDFTKAEATPQYHADLLGPVIGGGGTVDVSSFDDLFIQSGEAIIENQRGSVSLLQRKFGIGYGRASRIIDQLASVGLLGPFRDGKAREILMTMEDFRTRFAGKSGGDCDGDDANGDGTLAGLRDDEREPEAPWDDDDDVA